MPSSSIDSRPPFATRTLKGHTPLTVTLVGMALSVVVFFYIRREEDRDRVREFERRAGNTALRVEDYLQRREEVLFALRNYFEHSGSVSRLEFEGFARDLRSRQIGIHALEWVPVIRREDRPRVEAEMRAAGFRDFQFSERADAPNQLRRSADRPLHAPVLFLEPFAGNEPALGYDIASDAGSWGRMQRYAEAGQIAASGRLPLLVPSQGGPQWGYIVSLPVYKRPATTVAPAERLAELRGFVLGIFQLSDVFEEMFRRMGGIGVDVLFLDCTPTTGAQFLHFHSADPVATGTPPPTVVDLGANTHTVIPINRAGRKWELWFRPGASWLASYSTYRSWLFGSVFFCTSIAAGLYLRGVQRRARLIERRVAERTAELSESQRTLDGFLHALPGMAYRGYYDEDFEITYVSEGSVALTGYRPEDFLSGRIHLRDLVHRDDLASARTVTRAAAASGGEIEVSYRIRTRDGVEKWVLSRGRSPGRNERGLPLFEGLAIDVTAQKKAEQEGLALERKLLEGQKLESLGLLAGGVAHDFNNLLTGVLGNAALARLGLPPASPLEPQMRAIEHAALRAAELCRQMLAYAGKGRFVIEALDLTLLVEGLLPLLNTSIAHRAELKLAVARDLPSVMADATQLRQIVMNLVLNAADAIGDKGGTITITTGRMRADATYLASGIAGRELQPGEYVFLEVADTGVGMTPEVLARIFEPFFTTKFAGRGLGLAATLGIVRSHSGALQVASEPGRGSRFRLLLPPTRERGTLPAAALPAETEWHRTGHVLIIDDDEAVRQVTAGMLKSVGLTPRVCADGRAGLAAFREDPAHYDLVVLDLMMPAMNGEETLAVLRTIRPDVRVLLMSGYSEGDLLRRLHNPTSPLAFLSKPFERESLVEKLREMLG